MKVLFLHPNYPAQFRHIAHRAAIEGHEIKFLCQTHYGRVVPGVDRITLKNSAGFDHLEKLNLNILDRSEMVAIQYRQGFEALAKKGWAPDLVISHSGWGCGLYVKEIWPKCRKISYLEWWFNPESSFFQYDRANKSIGSLNAGKQKCWLRNKSIALELAVSDEIVSPTYWQHNQLPESFRQRCNVIFDGIDLSKFCPTASSSNIRKNVITYGTRGMDPMRCFPQFIKSLPTLLSRIPDAIIEIAGADEAFYGEKRSPGGESWGTWAKDYMKSTHVDQKVRWLGRLSLEKYTEWLKTSGCHIYLTHPFIASWSLVESYCCGIPIVASNVSPVSEICTPDVNIRKINHQDPEKLGEYIADAVESIKDEDRHTTALARKTKRYSVETAWRAWKAVAGL